MRLAWRLARRELRAGLSGFRVFVAALALGVAAIAAVGTLAASVTRGLQADARVLLGGDVEVALVQRPTSDAEAAYLRAHAAATSGVVEMRAMAVPSELNAAGSDTGPAAGSDARAMVELKAVDAAYPLVGQVQSDPPARLGDALVERDGAWGALVDPALLDRLGVGIGSRLRIGGAHFAVRGSIVREPDRVANVISFGPRVLVSRDSLEATGLVQPGSLVRYRTRVLLPEGTDAAAWSESVQQAFPTAGWQLRAAAAGAPGVQRFVDRLQTFLVFAGLSALLIGGLGVGNAVRHHLDSRAATIATLKCLGAPGALIVQVYLIQVLVLALLGIGIGLVLGAALPALGLRLLANILPVPVAGGLAILPLLQAALLGLLTTLAFALWPLGRARETPAGSLFRQAVVQITQPPRPGFRVATAAAVALLAAVTIGFSGNPAFAAWFVGGAMLTLLLLRSAAGGVKRAAEWLPVRAPVVRLAVAALRRPDAPTRTVMMSLGAGLTLLVAVALIDSNIRSQIGERLPQTVPAFFFIDIQDDQAAAFDATVRSVPGVETSQRVPSLRARIVRIKGVPVEQAPVAPESAWAVNGDRALTYAARPPEDAQITAGAWWPSDYAGPPLLSLDAGLARGFGVGVGDTLAVNVLGRELELRIASLREIDWRAVPFDFALILSPGTLEGAPHTHIAAVYAEPGAERPLEKAVTDRFVNVTAIPTRQALEAVSTLLARIGWGVRAAAALTLVAGALVLAGAIAADRRRRRYEAVMFKVLGATRSRIALIYLGEYGLLGLVTALVAVGLGTAVAWAIVTRLMQFDWTFHPGVAAGLLLACVVLTLVVGFLGTWRVLGERPAPYMRNE